MEEASAIVQGKAWLSRCKTTEIKDTYQDESIFDNKSWMRQFHKAIGNGSNNSRVHSKADSGPNTESLDQKLKLVGARQQGRVLASMEFSDIFGDSKEKDSSQLTERSSIDEY
jgi:hypothetical protein